MGGLGRLFKRWSLLDVQRIRDALDLRDVRPFMAGQPPCIEVHCPFNGLSCPVTIAERDQPSGANGSRSTNSAVRCIVNACNEG